MLRVRWPPLLSLLAFTLRGAFACSPFVAEGTSAGDAREAGTANMLEREPSTDAETPMRCDPSDLCLDFDGKDTNFYDLRNDGGATADVDAVLPYRGSRSLHLKHSNSTDSGPPNAALSVMNFPSNKCDFMLWIDHTGDGKLEIFANYRLPIEGGKNDYQILGLVHSNDLSEIVEQWLDGPPRFDKSPIPGLNLVKKRWTHVETEVTSAESLVAVDGTTNRHLLKFGPTPDKAKPLLIFGMNFTTAPSDTWDIFIDDIRCIRSP